MFSPHGMTFFKAGDAACFCEIRLGRRCVKHHDHAVRSGTLLVPKYDRICKALWAWVRVLAMLVSFGIFYLARLQDFWQDMFCKCFVFPSVVKLLEQLPSTASCSQNLKEWESIWAFAVLSWSLRNASPSFRPQLLTEGISFSTVRSSKEQLLASEQANLQVELGSSFSVAITWSFPAQSVDFSCVALLLICWTAALAAVHRCIQECVWKSVVFQREEFRK